MENRIVQPVSEAKKWMISTKWRVLDFIRVPEFSYPYTGYMCMQITTQVCSAKKREKENRIAKDSCCGRTFNQAQWLLGSYKTVSNNGAPGSMEFTEEILKLDRRALVSVRSRYTERPERGD